MRRKTICEWASRLRDSDRPSRLHEMISRLGHCVGSIRLLATRFALLLSILALSGEAAMARDASQDDTISAPQFTGAPSLETTPVDIRMSGNRWRIPRNFLEIAMLYKTYTDPENYTNTASLTIVTTFPELTGATPATIRCYKPLGACPNTIILDSLGPGSRNEPSARNGPAIRDAAQAAQAGPYGLVKVATRISLVPKDVYVFRGDSDESSVVIGCPQEDGDKIDLCRVYIDVHGTPFLYRYKKYLLPHWREIHDGIMHLFHSFYVGEIQ
ncbi:hypothetical protein IY145_20590 [Methylosinus sp. H3A]|uniref:hypothetical protein n=1 Tax=Methylosinus sp. H3A TaxID=2785786 RepID=UPI0018C2CDF5|nr:hypothetical protein [Methylosinus sp. H3A]MBG0811754.1 hypothetical protein [Methylosinus sp. H3A]